MPVKAVDKLVEAAAALRDGMESADAAAIETSIDAMRDAIKHVQAIGVWHSDPALRQRFADLLPELDSSRMLSCLLRDMTGQRLAALSRINDSVPQQIYRRIG